MKVIQVFTDFPNKYQPYNKRLIDGLIASNSDLVLVSLTKTSVKSYGGLPIVTTRKTNIFDRIYCKLRAQYKILVSKNKLKGLNKKQQLFFYNKYYFIEDHSKGVFHFHKIQSISKVVLTYLINNKIKYVVSLRGYDITVYPYLSDDNMDFTIRVLQHAWRIHSVCDSLKEDAVKLAQIRREDIHTIYRTPNVRDAFQAPVLEKLPDEIHIFTISRIHWKKCIAESLGAIRDLRRNGYNVKYHILGGFQGYENEKLLYLIKKMDLEDSVFLKGYVEEKSFKTHIEDKHIFWLPTVNEGVPNTLYYILKCGFPVVASATNGIPEIIESDKTGLLFEPYNFNELVNQTERVIKDNDLRRSLQLNAKDIKLQTSEAEIKQYLSFYYDNSK